MRTFAQNQLSTVISVHDRQIKCTVWLGAGDDKYQDVERRAVDVTTGEVIVTETEQWEDDMLDKLNDELLAASLNQLGEYATDVINGVHG